MYVVPIELKHLKSVTNELLRRTIDGTIAHTANTIPAQPPKADLTTVELTEISRASVAEFLQRTKIPLQRAPPPAKDEVARRTLEGSQEWAKKGLEPARYERHFKTSVNIAAFTFSHTPVDVQVQIALFTLLALCIDDLEVSSEAMDAFSARLYGGIPQLDPLLDCLVDVLTRMPDYYHPYAAKTIVVATVEFIDATLFDKQSVGFTLHENALPYVEFKRLRNSLGGVYGSFVWDKASFPDIFSHIQVLPETFVFLNYANDILSFYKEELAGERDNYVHDRALVTKKDISIVLTQLVGEVIESIERARTILKGEKEKEAWERLLEGYVAYHYMTPRYKLEELLSGDSLVGGK